MTSIYDKYQQIIQYEEEFISLDHESLIQLQFKFKIWKLT